MKDSEIKKIETHSTKIKKWGNSLAVRVPKKIVDRLNLRENSPVHLEMRDGELKIKPRESRNYTLEELVNEIDENNLHDSIDTTKTVGKEVW
ncbi:MAG: AbrB/MazE/SpoVT family DNA-binding domain-containing protein [Candidatus Magasanikbacteria bacterium]